MFAAKDYALSLHDALPISRPDGSEGVDPGRLRVRGDGGWTDSQRGDVAGRRQGRPGPELSIELSGDGRPCRRPATRSEEHTSELQSRRELVCRLLLEKKNR